MTYPFLPALATAFGAFGKFPPAPSFMVDLQEAELFTWFCLFVLIWQGGGGKRLLFSVILTLVLFLIHTLIV